MSASALASSRREAANRPEKGSSDHIGVEQGSHRFQEGFYIWFGDVAPIVENETGTDMETGMVQDFRV